MVKLKEEKDEEIKFGIHLITNPLNIPFASKEAKD